MSKNDPPHTQTIENEEPKPEAESAPSPELETREEDEAIVALVQELTEARKAADEAEDAALRAQAELQNFRRRKEREAQDRIMAANRNLLLSLLPVIDDFERAFANVPSDLGPESEAWVAGFELILRKLQTLLEREGVTPVEASGEFDPNVHEAISTAPSDTVESGHIIEEVQRGYMLGSKLLRPSYVRVAD